MAALAVAEAAQVAEAAEGAEASESFQADSEDNALSKGVNVAAITGMGLLSLASTVLSLVVTVKKGKEAATDIQDQRYAAGILTKAEDRNKLLAGGLIPAYYAGSNVKMLIQADKIPLGWSTTVLVDQGFGPEVALQQGRQRARRTARKDAESRQRQTLTNASKNRLALAQATSRAVTTIRQLKASVV